LVNGLSGIVHKLKNTLSPISIEAELLKEDFDIYCAENTDPRLDTMRESIGAILDRSQEAMKLSREILAIQSMDSTTKVVCENTIINLRELVADYKLRFRHLRLRSCPVEINTHIQSQAAAWANRSHIEAIMTSLVVNGVEALERGGTIDLVVGTSKELDMEDYGGDYVCVQVKDDGPGVEDVFKERIFDEMFSTKHDGSGVGLYQARRLAQLNKGRLTIRDNVDSGSIFTLWLPAVHHYVGSILVVDDEEPSRYLIKQILENQGHDVDLAENGDEALKMLTTHPYDVVISDGQMPVMGGDKLKSEMSAFSPHTPLVRVSASVICRNIPKLEVPKPFEADDITAAVYHALQSTRQAPD